MKKKIYTLISVLICSLLMILTLCTTVSANGIGDNPISRRGAGNTARSSDTASSNGNIDSGTDGHIDENSGTGEFGDDTSKVTNPSSDTPGNMIESAADDVVDGVTGAVDGAMNAVEDATGGNMWGIIIAIVIIVGGAALLFALFSRKK